MGLGCSNQRKSQDENFTFSLKDQMLIKKLQICSGHYYHQSLKNHQIKQESELLAHLREFGKIYNLPSEFETVANVQLHEHYKAIREVDGAPITSSEFAQITTKIIDDYFRSEILGKILRFETLMKMPRDNNEPDTIKNSVAVEYLPLEDTNILQSGFKLGISPNMLQLMIKLKTIQNLEESTPRKMNEDKQGMYLSRVSSGVDTIDVNDFIPMIDDNEMLTNWNLSIPAIENDLEKSRLVWRSLERLKLLDEFKVPLDTLANFFNEVRAGYIKNKNPFHNYDHALQVMHATQFMLCDANLKKDLSKLLQLGILISSYCHDVDHTGRTNAFEVEKGTALAIEYNDRSVLENHHASYTFSILKKDKCNIFKELSKDDLKIIRKLIVSCILATDMAVHGQTTKAMQQLQEKVKIPNTLSKRTHDFSDYHLTEQDIQLVTGYFVHAADLSGPAKNFDLAYLWAVRVNQEFTNQVNEEKELGLPLTKHMMNLQDPKIMAKNEIGFMKFVIKPLWETINEYTNMSMRLASVQVEDNIRGWEKKLKEAQDAEDRQTATETKAQ
eukprot:CAMPEP_0176443124 /NCGR_PEP_ID=MMETSP0127-20121128/22232_1 /TAXON_ID=938130 /ORGANISM="Platyophrya macrostoma, Strain WH" /LENGTH=556 /DNA_ID=CAMNT_0017828285 /DNA_START=20 /DNA_END=1690 /DNA_ORIENTATION=-